MRRGRKDAFAHLGIPLPWAFLVQPASMGSRPDEGGGR